MEDIPRLPTKGDTIAYGRAAGEQGMRRWQESQDPQKRLKFMTMGREFAIPYNLTQFSYMSLNHMRELRTYYRKIMYEMPQFGRTTPPLALWLCVFSGCGDADGRICEAV